MKLGLATSTALHAGVLAWALVSLHAPAPMEQADVEALPVDLVSVEEFTTIVAGAKDAPRLDDPAPTPVEADPIPEPAENVGTTDIDVAVDPSEVEKPVPVEKRELALDPDPVPDAFEMTDVPAPSNKPARPVAPTTEIADVAEPAVPVVPDPAPEPAQPVEVAKAEPVPAEEPAPADDPIRDAIEASEPVEEVREVVEEPAQQIEPEPVKPAEPQFAALPTAGPQAVERPPQARRSTTPERKVSEPTRTARRSESGERNTLDEVAALLNRDEAAGGQRRPDRPASQGGDRTTGAKLSSSEMDALRRRISGCWTPPSAATNAGELVARVKMQLDRSGNVVGRPEIISTSGGNLGRLAAEAGSRAMRACAPYNDLPADKYETWREVVVNFDPSEMFR